MEVDPLDSSVRRSSGSHVRRVSQSERRRRSELDESTETPIVLPGRPSGSDFGDFGTADEVIDLPPEDVVESHRMPRSRPRPLGPSDAELGALSGPREADSDSFYLESPSESAWEAFRSDDMVDPHAGPLQPLSEGWSAAAAPPPPRPRALSRSSGFKGPTIDLHGSESVPSLPLAEAGASQGIFSESLLTSDSREPNFPSEDAPDDPEWRRLDESFEGTFPSAESWEGLALPQEASQSVAQRMGNLWSGEGLWLLLTVGGALLGPLLIWAGWQYYSLADSARPNHSLHRLLNANRPIGLWAGIVGSVLFVANLTYVLRRRFGFLSKLVSMRAWLNWHMVFGVTGGSLILVHSGLLAGNLVARISAAAIFVAIVSGLFGRYFLAHVPRRQEGDTADRAELAALLGELRGDLRKRLAPYPKLRAAALEALSAAEEQGDEEQGFFAIMLDMVLGPIRRRAREQLLAQRFRKLLDMEASADPELEELLEEVLDLLYLHGRLHRRLSQFEGVQDLMDTWRGLHMILALVMLATMFVHIAIAIQYGNLKFF
ncbi:MAG TPA: hypothetical protein DEA08_02025 [Planctomycetes bacterium]|nr:hypothetical protein [Planctomycetota bacterium]